MCDVMHCLRKIFLTDMKTEIVDNQLEKKKKSKEKTYLRNLQDQRHWLALLPYRQVICLNLSQIKNEPGIQVSIKTAGNQYWGNKSPSIGEINKTVLECHERWLNWAP